MAQSPSHAFGQIVGDILEQAIEPLLTDFAHEHSLYLDKKGKRPTRRGTTVTWVDSNGNKHDLDYVLERNGTAEVQGIPVAFIETAWRRYTKHSRNKAQEIQGAILPLRETYQDFGPFIGTILAGVFTGGALTQLNSLGFQVAYFPYESVVEAFASVGIDARFDERTPDQELQSKVDAWKGLSPDEKNLIPVALMSTNQAAVDEFMRKLTDAILRKVESIRILALHGSTRLVESVEEAAKFITNYDDHPVGLAVIRFEIQIRFSDGSHIDGNFVDKASALEFLNRNV